MAESVQREFAAPTDKISNKSEDDGSPVKVCMYMWNYYITKTAHFLDLNKDRNYLELQSRSE